jgi:hypothetical protein
MGVRFELHELSFEVAANVVIVPDDGVNEEEASSGESENAKSIGCRSEGGVAAAVQVAGTRRDKTSCRTGLRKRQSTVSVWRIFVRRRRFRGFMSLFRLL